MPFEFATATRIIFGSGSAAQLPQLARAQGRQALLVTGSQGDRHRDLRAALAAAGLQYTVCPITSEPSVARIRAATERARTAGCDMVISIGGGSAIDSGKALAALIPNPGDPLDYLEVIGAGKKLSAAPLPFIALPTTAGTGAEVTKNAVLASPEHRVKVSLRDNSMLPVIALIDPVLTLSLPPAITASTGLDALTQLIEPYISRFANPLTDAFCLEGLRRVGRALRRAYAEPQNLAAREDMALASLLGGLALANAKLGAVHGFAGVLGGMYDAPHGAICAALLPHVLRVNSAALSERGEYGPVRRRLDRIAQLLTGAPTADAAAGLRWISETSQLFDIPGLGGYGLRAEDFASVSEKASASSSMKGNPITLTPAELQAILRAAL